LCGSTAEIKEQLGTVFDAILAGLSPCSKGFRMLGKVRCFWSENAGGVHIEGLRCALNALQQSPGKGLFPKEFAMPQVFQLLLALVRHPHLCDKVLSWEWLLEVDQGAWCRALKVAAGGEDEHHRAEGVGRLAAVDSPTPYNLLVTLRALREWAQNAGLECNDL
jgi:hypothetical protein